MLAHRGAAEMMVALALLTLGVLCIEGRAGEKRLPTGASSWSRARCAGGAGKTRWAHFGWPATNVSFIARGGEGGLPRASVGGGRWWVHYIGLVIERDAQNVFHLLRQGKDYIMLLTLVVEERR